SFSPKTAQCADSLDRRCAPSGAPIKPGQRTRGVLQLLRTCAGRSKDPVDRSEKAQFLQLAARGQARQGRRERGVLRTRATEDAAWRRASAPLAAHARGGAEDLVPVGRADPEPL